MNAGWVVKKVEYNKWAINGRNSISKALGSTLENLLHSTVISYV